MSETGDGHREATIVAHAIGPYGGMESQAARLVAELLELGVEVTVIARDVELAPAARLRIVRVRGPRRPFPLAYPWFMAAGSLAVARHRRGAVYAIGAIVANRVDARKVPFCHEAWARSAHRDSRASKSSTTHRVSAVLSAAISRLGERALYRPSRSGHLVAMSTGDARELEAIFPAMAPVPVIPNGIDPSRFRPDAEARKETRKQLGVSEDELIGVFVGGDWKRKGLPAAIGALELAPAWRLLVVGGGDKVSMTALAEERGVADRVIFAGRVPDPERHFAAADAVVMPSSYEPWGNAVLEGCACGLPVVVARANGVSDFVSEAQSGLFIEPHPGAIAEALRQLERPEFRSNLGKNARRRAEAYTYRAVALDYERLLLRDSATPERAAPAFAANGHSH